MSFLKKILPFCTLLFAIALLAGCAGSSETTVTSEPTASPEPTATPAPLTPEDVAAQTSAEYETFSDYESVFNALSARSSEQTDDEESRSGSASISAASVSDVMEGDIVCTDGEYLYAIEDKQLKIFHCSGEEGELVSSVSVGTAWSTDTQEDGSGFSGSEKTPLAMFVGLSRAAIVMDVYGYESTEENTVYSEYVTVDFYDVSDPANPVFLSSCGQDGVYSASWMEGETICVATDYSVYDLSDSANTKKYIPQTYTASDGETLAPENILMLSNQTGANGTVLGAYSVSNASMHNALAIFGAEAEDICPLSGKLFITDTRSVKEESRRMTDAGGEYTEYIEAVYTELFRFDFDSTGIHLAASGLIGGLLPEKSAIAAAPNGYVCLGEQSGTYYKSYGESSAEEETQSISGTCLYALDSSLACTASLSKLPNGENIVWAGFASDKVLLSGESASYIADVSASDNIAVSDGGDPMQADVLLSWTNGGYAAFRSESAGKLTLCLYDSSLKKTAERTFGSDYSSTLESTQSYMSLPEKNILGFSADDSYCLYTENNGEIEFVKNFFLNDWAWYARAAEQGENILLADRRELKIISAETFDVVTEYTF